MYKLFRNIGIISLILISFIYTEKIATVIKEEDEIMIEIKSNEKNYKIDYVDAIIENNTIIPGINGKQIDIENSYSKMKQYGKYDKGLLQYKVLELKNKLENHKDKFIIGGNNKKQMVSLVFVTNNINDIEPILSSKNIKTNFFLENVQDKIIINLIKKGYIVGSKNTNIEALKSIVVNVANQNNFYCYTEDYNEDILKKCNSVNGYTIVPNIIVNNSLIEMKKNIKNGSIIAVKNISDEVLDLMIQYINNKGYKIVTLDELFDENYY